MGDISDKAKSFLKKFSSPFGSSRKFKGQGHRLGSHDPPPPTLSPATQPAPPKIPPSKDDKQQWMKRESEQKLQQGDWRKQQQQKWAKEKNIPPSQLPIRTPSIVSDPHPIGTNLPYVEPSFQATDRSSTGKQIMNSRSSPKCDLVAGNDSSEVDPLPIGTDLPSVNPSLLATEHSSTGKGIVPSESSPICDLAKGDESAEVDVLLRAVEANEELAVALSSFLSAEPGSAALDILSRLLRNIVREPKSEKFRKIRMGNPKIKDALGSATDLLEGLGFRLVAEGGEIWAIMDEPVGEDFILLRGVIALVESQVEPHDPLTASPSSCQ